MSQTMNIYSVLKERMAIRDTEIVVKEHFIRYVAPTPIAVIKAQAEINCLAAQKKELLEVYTLLFAHKGEVL